MQEVKNNKLNSTLLMILQPIARLFLRYGRGYREYADLSKAAFIAVASEDYGVHGRPTNVSRIAAMTGLTRKEISRIRARLENGEGAATERGTPLHDIIAGWQTCDEFLDADGEPRALTLDGGAGSFQSLVKQFAGDIPEGAMRKELQRIGRARLVDETLHLQPPDPAVGEREEQMASRLMAGPYPLMSALAHNEAAQKDSEHWPLETVAAKPIRKSDVARVRKLVSVRLRTATTTISDLLDAYATIHDGEGSDEPTVNVSAGVYYAEALATDKK